MMMSTDSEFFLDQKEAAIAQMLAENKGDELTDMLVDGLYEALRLLQEELASDTFH